MDTYGIDDKYYQIDKKDYSIKYYRIDNFLGTKKTLLARWRINKIHSYIMSKKTDTKKIYLMYKETSGGEDIKVALKFLDHDQAKRFYEDLDEFCEKISGYIKNGFKN